MHKFTKIDRFSLHLCINLLLCVLIGISAQLNSKNASRDARETTNKHNFSRGLVILVGMALNITDLICSYL